MTAFTSFPRKRESSVARLRDKKLYALAIARSWIPAFAGMTLFFERRVMRI